MIHHNHHDTHHRIAMFLFGFILAVRFRMTDGFQPTVSVRQQQVRMRTVDVPARITTTYLEMAKRKNKHHKKNNNKNNGGGAGTSTAPKKASVETNILPSVDRNPFREVHVDVNKVKDVVDHFGDYSTKQMEEMRDDLHAHRVQSMVFGDDTVAPADMLQEQILEEELTLQLHLLQNETPDPYLFPEVTTKGDNQELKELLPHVQDGTASVKVQHELEHEKDLFFWEELMEEGVLESLAICSMIAILMAAPHIFQ